MTKFYHEIILYREDKILSEFTCLVLVLRLSWKWIGRGVYKFNIFKYCTLSVDKIKTTLGQS